MCHSYYWNYFQLDMSSLCNHMIIDQAEDKAAKKWEIFRLPKIEIRQSQIADFSPTVRSKLNYDTSLCFMPALPAKPS